MSIRLLGVPRFTVECEPWRFSAPPRTIPLLGYLVTAGGPAPREALSAALWPEDDDDESRVNLRRHLHHLHKALPPSEHPWFVTEGDTVEWSGKARVDVLEFRSALSAGDGAAAAACYGGEFLQGFYDEWIIAQRERLSVAYLGALSDLVADCRSARDHSAALSYAQRILEIDEWREDIVRAVMAIRYEAGDRAGALGTFERFARRLAEELHVEPMPETIALRDAIVRNASVSAASREAPLTIGPAGVTIPFVGRAEELERLHTLWANVARKTGGFGMVSGEAGIGKTRLVHEFALYVERQGGRVLVGGTSNPETMPYEALIQALRTAIPYLTQNALDALWMRVLGTVIPELQAHLPDGGALEPIGDRKERTRLFEAMLRALAVLARSRPFLIVLEDLHWASAETLQAIEFIARRLSGIPGIILGTQRDGENAQSPELGRMRRTLEREHRAVSISPGPLSCENVASMVGHMPQFADAPRDLAEVVHRTSDGNALFVVHLLRDFAETGALPDSCDVRTGTIAQTILSRARRLSHAALLVAEHAAIAGRAFSVDLLRDTTGWNEDDVLGAVSELLERLLIRASMERSRYEYEFTHSVVQQTIYEQIPVKERQRLHFRMAVVFERAEADRPGLASETALHWDRAGEERRAAVAYLRAADAAMVVYANQTARRYARRILELDAAQDVRLRALVQLATADERIGDKGAWESDVAMLLHAAENASPECRFQALACAVRRFDSIGDRNAQRTVIGEMKAIAAGGADKRQTAAALLAEGTMYWREGVFSAAIEPLTVAAQAAHEAADSELRLQSMVMLIKSLLSAGRNEAARAQIARAQDELDESAPPHQRLALLRASAGVAMLREDGAELERIATEQAALARSVGDIEGEGDAYRLFGYAAAYRELDLEAMREQWSVAAQMFERAGMSQEYAVVLTDLAGIDVELGRYTDAESLLAKALPIAQSIGWRVGVAIGTLNKAEVERCRGNLDAAHELSMQALACAQSTEHVKAHCTALVFAGWIECKQGKFTSGLARLREGVDLRRSSEGAWSLAADLCLLIEGLLMAQHVDAACEAARELEQIYLEDPKRQMSPAHICWTLARARAAAGDDAGYRRYVEHGRAALEQRCARFKDDGIRTAFRNRPFCRELDAESGKVLKP